MAKFKVTAGITKTYYMIVNAKNEDEAMEKAEGASGWKECEENYYSDPIPEIWDAEEV